MRAWVIDVRGTPAAQGSKRAIRVGSRTLLIEQSKRVKPWRAAVGAAAIEAGCVPRDGDIEVRITIRLARPANHYNSKGGLRSGLPIYPGRIDIDKAARAVLDALTGIAYKDDRQVCLLFAQRVWTDDADNEGALISVSFAPTP